LTHPAGNLDTDQRSFEGDKGALVVNIVSTFRNPLFGAFFRSSRAIEIDLMRALGGFSKNAHVVQLDLDKSPSHG